MEGTPVPGDTPEQFQQRLWEQLGVVRQSPQGFTRTDPIARILDPYEEVESRGGIVPFHGLPGADAARLLALLPMWQGEDRQNAAPTFRQFAEAGQRCPEMSFSGHRVVPERPDERITIDAFHIPVSALPHECVQELWNICRPSQAAIDDVRPPYAEVGEDERATAVDLVDYADIDIYLRVATDDKKSRQVLSAYWD